LESRSGTSRRFGRGVVGVSGISSRCRRLRRSRRLHLHLRRPRFRARS
jgi:hypothetical protein